MYSNAITRTSGFPDPLADYSAKQDKIISLQYAKAIYQQWGQSADTHSLYGRRNKVFSRNRDYANGTQDTTIYKQLLNSLDPNKGDGTLAQPRLHSSTDLPKFVKIVLNKILSSEIRTQTLRLSTLSSSEKNKKKDRIKMQVENVRNCSH